MFSRAAKSIVKTIGQRKYHAGEGNIKVTLMGGAGEIGRSLSQMLKQTSKLTVLTLNDVSSLNKFVNPNRFNNFFNGEPLNPVNSWLLTMVEKSRTVKDSPRQTMLQSVSYLSNGPSNIAKNETQELMETLQRLPIAEECSMDQLKKSKAIGSQGDNARNDELLRGPQIFGEMGPDAFQRGGTGCIVTEIYKQLPDLAERLAQSRTKRGNRPALRQLSTFTVSTARKQSSFENKQDTVVKSTEKISSVVKTKCAAEKQDKKRKKDTKKANVSVSALDEGLLKEIKDRPAIEKRKTHAKKSKEPKEYGRVLLRMDKRVGNVGKPRNWTIPAALSDRKPKLLYGLVQQRRTPLTFFFANLFETQKKDVHSSNFKYAGSKVKTADATRNEEMFEDSGEERLPGEIGEGDRKISISASDLMCVSAEKSEVPELNIVSELVGEKENPFVQLDRLEQQDFDCTEQKAIASSSNETISEMSESPRIVKNISSKLAQFLENLKISRQKSASLGSLTSYNLDSLFASEESTPVYDYINAVHFSSKSSDSKLSFKDKLAKKLGMKKNSPDKKQNKTTGKNTDNKDEPCKMPKSVYGPPCKKEEADKDCKQEEDVCKKYRKEEVYGSNCKGGSGQDPCKKGRKEEVYGKSCKNYVDQFGGDDPMDKFWKEKVYGKRCKQKKKGNVCGDPKCDSDKSKCEKKKESPCRGCKKPDPCGKSKKQDPCGKSKKQDPCGKSKKQDPCGKSKEQDPCGKSKEQDPCGKSKKQDPCGKSKKPDPCKKPKQPDSCGKKKPEPCRKPKQPDSCGKEKQDPCAKKPDPCSKKKQDPCAKKPDPCSKKKHDPCAKEKKPASCDKKKDCPPVFRAPGCPKDEGGGGKCNDPCRKYSTDSRIYSLNSFSYENASNMSIPNGLTRVISESSLPKLGRSINSLNVDPIDSCIVDN